MKKLNSASKYLFVVFLILISKNTNAQHLKQWNDIADDNEEKINFILFISPQDAIAKVPIYYFDSSTKQADHKLSLFSPALGMDGEYRFGEKINPEFWIGVNLETYFSIPKVSSKFCVVAGYENILSIKIFYDAVAVQMNHGSDIIGLSKNYMSTYAPGFELEIIYSGIHGNLIYEKSSKIEFLNSQITYDFITDKLSVGMETKSIFGSGPMAIYYFGRHSKQISISWLIPKNPEKERYESRNGFYIKTIFPIY